MAGKRVKPTGVYTSKRKSLADKFYREVRVRVYGDMYKYLSYYARQNGTTKAKLVRKMINHFLQSTDKQKRDILERF